jgi:hypothetical protein
VLAPSEEAFDTPLSPPRLHNEPGPATRRSGTYRDGTHTRWPDPASRTHHDAQVSDLVAALYAEAVAEIGRCYLEPDEYADWIPGSPGWQVANEEVAGRFEYDPDTGTNGPHGVVIDGRYLTWQEFGAALSSYEGWRFRLLIEDPSSDYHPT